jgi:hypothetical protein
MQGVINRTGRKTRDQVLRFFIYYLFRFFKKYVISTKSVKISPQLQGHKAIRPNHRITWRSAMPTAMSHDGWVNRQWSGGASGLTVGLPQCGITRRLTANRPTTWRFAIAYIRPCPLPLSPTPPFSPACRRRLLSPFFLR